MSLPRWLLFLFFCVNCSFVFAGSASSKLNDKNYYTGVVARDIQKKITDTIVIRFDYKQSALYHPYTFIALDSVIDILLKNKAATISIDGYAYKDEGSDTICYYLSLNRALFIQTYVLGRGIDSSRILYVTGHGRTKPLYRAKDKDGLTVNCRAEIMLNYPPGIRKIEILDSDKDGIPDDEDKCPDVFGYKEKDGCPLTGFVIVPFESQQSSLFALSYRVLDSVILILNQNPAMTISIEGHAYKGEGINAVGDRLGNERASIVKNYLLSRRIDISRIDSVKSLGNSRPLNAGNNPQEIVLNCRAEIYFSSH